jgi:curved DNA-binding protein CbpA
MFDAFSLLQMPRRPWLPADEVRAKFQRLAATAHPDRSGNPGDFAELTRAYETLREPVSLLRHFLALECPGRANTAVPPADLVEWFPRVAAQLQTLKRDGASARESAAPLLAELNALRTAALTRVRELAPADFDGLAQQLGRLSFLDKWTAQLGEALLALDL